MNVRTFTVLIPFAFFCSLLTCNSLSEHHPPPPRGRASLEEMTSISQYVERRPSDSNCLMQHSMAVGSMTPPTTRRSLPDMHNSATPPAPPPPSMVTTVSLAPRKSALKGGSSTKLIEAAGGQMVTSTFRTHLPPPEFADTSPPGSSGGRHFTIAEVQPPHSSFRTLPRPLNPLGEPQNTQTLPLKSNLKKTTTGGNASAASGNVGGSKNTLQWSSDHHTGASNLRQNSMEELRV